MAFKELDDRQVIQRSTLSISIGSSANTTLDVLFGLIDSKMANLNGVQTLTNKTLSFLQTEVVTDSTTTGAAATISGTYTGDGTVILTNASLTSISGITAGLSAQYITLENQTGSLITINNDDAGAAVGNQIYTGTGAGLSMPNNATITFVYNSTIGFWMLTGTAGSAPAKYAPTQQIFLSGSGTYTTPVSPAPLYIEIEMVGGGGGGGAAGNTAMSPGGNGTASTFGTLLTAGPGVGGNGSYPAAGYPVLGGTGTITAPAVGFTIAGGSSTGSGSIGGGGGGAGGNSAFGGGGGGGGGGTLSGTAGSGTPAAINSGSGGGGGASGGNGAIAIQGSGGSAGAFVEAVIPSPSATYAYSVGTGGAGATGDESPGGAGGSGIIRVTEYYQ
jgi:hypothetical protein